MKTLHISSIVIGLLLVAAGGAHAQDEDSEPITLTVRNVAERAAEAAPRVAIADESAALAVTRADWSLAMGLVPRLDLRGSYTRLSEVALPEFSFGGTAVENPFPQVLDQFLLRATVTLPLTDAFLISLPQYDSARAAAIAAEAQADVERRTAALRAVEALYGYVRAEAAIAVTEQAMTLLEEQVRSLTDLETAGEATIADVAQARAQLAEAHAQLATARGALRGAERALHVLLGIPADRAIVVGVDLFDRGALGPGERTDDLIANALDHRPEFRAMRALAEVHEGLARAHEGGRLPHVSISANFDYANPSPRIFPMTATFTPTWDASVVLSWSPNAMAAEELAAQGEWVEAHRAEADLADLTMQLEAQAAQLVSELEASRETIAAAEESLESARIAFEARRDLLAAGEATASELLTAESSLRRAEAARVDAYVLGRLARARIDHLSGADLGR